MSPNDDIFGQVFTSDGFAERYTRKLKPQTKAELDADRAAHAEGASGVMHEFLTGEKAPVEVAAGQADGDGFVTETLTPIQQAALAEIEAELAAVDDAGGWHEDDSHWDAA